MATHLGGYVGPVFKENIVSRKSCGDEDFLFEAEGFRGILGEKFASGKIEIGVAILDSEKLGVCLAHWH